MAAGHEHLHPLQLDLRTRPGDTVASAATAGLLWLGGGGVSRRVGVSIGTLTAFVLLFAKFFTPLINLGDEWQAVQAALAGAERVFTVLALPDRRTRTAPTRRRHTVRRAAGDHPGPGRGSATSPDRPVLHDISLTVAAGEHVALVGRSGAGKTSILALLTGLYRPDRGRVRLAGHDPATFDRRRPPGPAGRGVAGGAAVHRHRPRQHHPRRPDHHRRTGRTRRPDRRRAQFITGAARRLPDRTVRHRPRHRRRAVRRATPTPRPGPSTGRDPTGAAARRGDRRHRRRQRRRPAHRAAPTTSNPPAPRSSPSPTGYPPPATPTGSSSCPAGASSSTEPPPT